MTGVALVTGGAGFVGSHLVEALLAEGLEVHCLDRISLDESLNLAAVRDHPRLRYVCGDIRDADALDRLFGVDADTVYHLASIVGVKHYMNDPLGLIDVVVGGTRQIIQRAYDRGVKIVFASTSEIYGRNPAVPWTEDDDRVLGPPHVDRWSYSSSKAVCEHMLHGLGTASGLDYNIVRFFNVYGPRQAPYYVISQSIHRALNGEPPLLYDAGAQTRCFTYVHDIIDGLLRVGQSHHPGETFNLGNATETTVRDAVDAVLRLSGYGGGVVDLDTSAHYGERYEDIDRRIPAVGKAKKFLEWEAQHSLEDGLVRTIDWARRSPRWLASAAG